MIEIEIKINASIGKVWEAWTNEEAITKWNFASDDWICPKAQNTLETGEEFSWRMEAKDGSFGFDFKGTYTEIIPNKSIKYNLEDGRNVEIKFQENKDHVYISEAFEPEGTNSDEMQKAGWQAILGNFKNMLKVSKPQ